MNKPGLPGQPRLGVIGIFIYHSDSIVLVNQILAGFSNHIRGRLGVPRVEFDPPVSVISLIFEGTTDEMGAMTGKLGQGPGIEVKSLISKNYQFNPQQSPGGN